jgi:hypothetical protein
LEADLSTQKDLELCTPEELRADGWKRLGPNHGRKRLSGSAVSNFYSEPKGPKAAPRNGSTGTVTTVVLTRRCWQGILNELDREWDGRETAVPLPHYYCASLHTHPVGSKPIPSDADSYAWGVRAKKEIGNLFLGLIVVPEDGGIFHAQNMRAYITEPRWQQGANLSRHPRD